MMHKKLTTVFSKVFYQLRLKITEIMKRSLCIPKLLRTGKSLRELLSFNHTSFLTEKERELMGQNQEPREQRSLENDPGHRTEP